MMKRLIIIGFLATLAVTAHAQPTHAQPPVVTATTVTGSTDSESMSAYKAIDAKTQKAATTTNYTGDADVDFLRGAIPYQQGVVDMANTVLKYGSDADVRMMAGDVIKANENHLRAMKEWLVKHGPTVLPDAKASDARAEAKPVERPKVVITKTVEKVTESRMQVAATLPVSASVPASGSLIVTSSLPPVDEISATQALMETPNTATAMVMPVMPKPEDEILNVAPKMEFLDSTK